MIEKKLRILREEGVEFSSKGKLSGGREDLYTADKFQFDEQTSLKFVRDKQD